MENKNRPSLVTERLVLRPFVLSDAEAVQRMAGHPLVAATTATIPHPYPDGAAQEWINKHNLWFQKGNAVQFAITLKENDKLIGCIDLNGIADGNSKAELGYWIGVDYWNNGYCSEAALAVLKFGFEKLNLNKITSRHMSSNPSSGRVMVKAGMKKEGLLRQEFKKNGIYVDIEVYGILRTEFTDH